MGDGITGDDGFTVDGGFAMGDGFTVDGGFTRGCGLAAAALTGWAGGAGVAAGVALAAAAGAVAHAGWRTRLGEPRPGLPSVLAYHKIGSVEFGGTWCSVRQLRGHLEALQHAGVKAVDRAGFERRLDSLAGVAADPDAAPPAGPAAASPAAAAAAPPPAAAREILITVDDAFESFATHAWPDFRARSLPVLLFVVTDFVGRRSTWDLPLPGRRAMHLDWQGLRDLVRQGVEIGSHAATHRDLRRLGDLELARELEGSRRRLEDTLGVAVRSVAYPFGRVDARVRAAAEHAGYTIGFSMCPPGPNGRLDRLALRRWGIYVVDSPGAVLAKADPSRPGFWRRDLACRAINACAVVAAWGSSRETARRDDEEAAGGRGREERSAP